MPELGGGKTHFDLTRRLGVASDATSAAVSKIVGEWYKFDFGDSDAERLRYVSKYMRQGKHREGLLRALDEGKDVTLTTRAYDWTLNDGK